MKSLPIKPGWLLALLFWLAMIASGHIWLLRYSFAEGATSMAPHTIPASLGLPPRLARPQFLLALHPRCPCSRATLNELAKILTRAPHASDVTVLIYKPADEPDAWMDGPLLESCRRMACRICPDPDGRLAASLGRLTSGGVVLYDADGRLRYQGGITASRGHEGDNAGERGVIEILCGRQASQKSMPVFGCPVQSGPNLQNRL
jgi:hypothetical protein